MIRWVSDVHGHFCYIGTQWLHAVRCHCSCIALNVRLLRIDLRPHSLVHVQGFFVGVSSLHFSDCDLFRFLENVCNGLDSVLDLVPATFIFFARLTVLFPVSLCFLLVFCLWWHLIQKEIISESSPQPVNLLY